MKLIQIKPEVIQLLKDTPNCAYDSLMIEFMYQNNCLESLGFYFEEIYKMIHNSIFTGTHNISNTQLVLNQKDVFDYMIETLEQPINGDMLQSMHNILMDKTWEDLHGFKGEWKKLPNCIMGSDVEFSRPDDVEKELYKLIERWNTSKKTLDDIIDYHVRFEHIHPFQFGNGIVGRLLMLKQCIENDVDLIIINENQAGDYTQGLYTAQMCNDDRQIKTMIHHCQQITEDRLPDFKQTLYSIDWDQLIKDEHGLKGEITSIL